MHEARLRPDNLGQVGQEGDDVVLGLALDLVDPRHVENGVPGLAPDHLRRLLRDHTEFRQRIRRMRLDLEPDLEAGLGLPDGGHFRAGIAGNHRLLLAQAVVRKWGLGFCGQYTRKQLMEGIFSMKTGCLCRKMPLRPGRALAEQPR